MPEEPDAPDALYWPPRVARPTDFYLIRHAEVHNPRALFYGRLPRFRLSVAGEARARGIAETLTGDGVRLAAVYSSPRLRARQTAAPLGQKVRLDKELDELRTHWQGTPQTEIGRRIAWDFFGPGWEPGDETLPEVAARLERFLDRALRRHQGEAFAAVTHGDPLLILAGRCAGLPLLMTALRPAVYPDPGVVLRLAFRPDQPRPTITPWPL